MQNEANRRSSPSSRKNVTHLTFHLQSNPYIIFRKAWAKGEILMTNHRGYRYTQDARMLTNTLAAEEDSPVKVRHLSKE